MTLEAALISGLGVLSGVVGVMWRALAQKDKQQAVQLAKQDERIEECEKERKELRRESMGFQKQLTEVWKELYTHGIERKKEDTPS